MPPESTADEPRFSRRRLLGWGLGGAAVVVVAAASGFELVSHDVLPGKQTLDELEGACSVSSPPLVFPTTGTSISGTFFSRARATEVGYTIAYPPGHGPGSALPLIVMLHGFGADHTNALADMTPAQAVALEVDAEFKFKSGESGRVHPRLAIDSSTDDGTTDTGTSGYLSNPVFIGDYPQLDGEQTGDLGHRGRRLGQLSEIETLLMIAFQGEAGIGQDRPDRRHIGGGSAGENLTLEEIRDHQLKQG